MSPRCPFYPSSSLTDAEWAILQPLRPPPGNTGGKGGRREEWPRRLICDWADGGYVGRLVDWAKFVLALTIQIVKRSNTATGFEVLPRRWVVERTFGWLVKHRRLIRDYETRPDHHEAMVYLAAIHTLTRRLARDSGPVS